MYIDLLRQRLLEQQEVYRSLKAKKVDEVCYKEYKHKEYGTQDANYRNRMRLVYYLLYEKIMDEDVIVYLFQEELRDRENNSFQGIGDTIEILTYLLKRYNSQHKYDDLFEKAKNANFDCFCGYDVDVQISEDIEENTLLDCIYLCQSMDYKDVMEQLVAEWKKTITEWNDSNCKLLIRFYSFLDKEVENEELYKEQLKFALSTGNTFAIVSGYSNIIRYYLDLKKYELAYTYLDLVLKTENFEEIKHIRLFGDLLEAAFEIISHYPEVASNLWQWAKGELQDKTNMYGNLYIKAIDAAKAVHTTYAIELEKQYKDWKKKMGLM